MKSSPLPSLKVRLRGDSLQGRSGFQYPVTDIDLLEAHRFLQIKTAIGLSEILDSLEGTNVHELALNVP